MKRTTSKTFKRDRSPKRLRRTQSAAFAPRQFGPSLSKETGYVDSNISPAAGNTTGTIQLINTIAAGTGVTQRVGKKVQLKSLQIRGIMNSDSATLISQYAVMIVWDRRPSGALPLITDILDSVSPISFLNDANSSRFKVLWRDDFVNINSNTNANNEAVAKVYNEFIKFSKKSKANRTTYKAAGTGVIADIDEGALYFISVGGNVSGTADSVGSFNTRLRFWDI